jgi:plasmid stabilization system protein ParE
MAQVIYSDEAFTDFERIIEFLQETSPQAAAQALDGIRSAFGILEAHPYIGRRVDDQIRELVISRRKLDISLSIVSIPHSTLSETCEYDISARQVTETNRVAVRHVALLRRSASDLHEFQVALPTCRRVTGAAT